MYGKLAVAAGFAAGYVLGSKAGRQRYEEIVAQARKVADNEKVQSTAGVLQAKGSDLVEKAKQSELANKVKSTVSKDKTGTSTYGTTPSTTAMDTGLDTTVETPTTTVETPSTTVVEPDPYAPTTTMNNNTTNP
jgi:hypothetical protein